MEGPKRLDFTTVGPVGTEQKKAPTPKTFRLVLDLSDSTDTTCPEFFYSELVKPSSDANKSIVNKSINNNPDDPFGDDDEEKMQAIAKSFEDKYNKQDGKKKKKKKWRDHDYLAYLGDGYDESDTFIDNSEAYDELLPETMTTKLGGFYINSGKLDLKEMSDNSEDEFLSPQPVKKNKKRRISSDEDSDGEQKIKKKKIKDTLTVDGDVKKKKKKKLIVPPGEKPFKKPKLLKENKNGKQSAVSALIKSTSPNMNGERPVENGFSNPSENGEGQSHLKSNISMVIESVVAMATQDDSNSQDVEEPKKVVDPESIPNLPDNLPSGMEAKLNELKILSKDAGKVKFFTAGVNKLLLEVEIMSKQMSTSQRSAMFGHLAAYLPCSKDTLLKRARSLRAKELEDKIKAPMERLKQAVNRIMPGLLEKYEEECKKVAIERQEESMRESGKEETEEGGTEDDEEKTSQSESSKKRVPGPRKHFTWDSETRSALCDVVRVKMNAYSICKPKSQSAEEFCKAFLETEVRPIWLKGWMQTRVLFKESKSAHSIWTNPQKTKKLTVLGKKTFTSPSMGGNTPSPGCNMSMSSDGGSIKAPSVTVTKITPGSGSLKSAVGAANVKQVVHTPNTPMLPPKKAVPTLLDYAQGTSNSGGASNSMSMTDKSNSKSIGQGPHVEMIKIINPKLTGSSQKSSDNKTWDHKASDILRSSMASEVNKTSPQKPIVQRQNSNSISTSQAANSYLAQFANFANAPIALLKSSNNSGSNSNSDVINLSTKTDHQYYQTQLEIERQKQILKLTAEQRQMIEKTKQLQQQQQKQQQAAKNVITVSRPSGNVSHSSLQNNKSPSQSPMSLAMSKNIPSSQGASKTTPKQLASQFSKYSEQLIRQQLSDSGNMSMNERQGKMLSPTDPLRKTSPQAQQVRTVQPISQVNHSAKPQQMPHLQSHGHIQGAAHAKPVVTDGGANSSATSLLKSLFGQMTSNQSKPQSFPSTHLTSPQRLQGSTLPKPVVSPQSQISPKQWNSGSSSGQMAQATFANSMGHQAKQAYIQAVSGMQAYPAMKLSSEQQQAAYQAQQHRLTMFGKSPTEGPK
ncbi:ubinuclein-2-like isoform X2 [Mya arenaria]|uniref:ubinuclein-2-like isoform X2 n=1 Tax=Mya arenaria TaxID=6604 RepID=UPI0022E7B362|nr:ubinuclein-2-like isoform X2 [Mya arenaria]